MNDSFASQFTDVLDANFDASIRNIYIQYAKMADNDINKADFLSNASPKLKEIISALENYRNELKRKKNVLKGKNDPNFDDAFLREFQKTSLKLNILNKAISEAKTEIHSLQLENQELEQMLAFLQE
ncbi:hypothetical protein TVAG_605470 [Trichomonas vaginalis G3]|uniref:Uncharacterized protein n=1 Tax=Trichomonas vaginalis (strain ATCC PRA-98 / G3) TaxID=412133 RepID=A2GX38_TRIV3|nr:hypothetical protein TVAGG3_0418280 [Trichomonas vaginalis G3]EAX78278.1 hypothetical protein TVAG_605470 [Trichomonas vaginalis G3]KAI5535851.1 hypothetical protein TVAGG3_0418280 [Trichomonas vaginalis G3]|eukprot:XP_001291208.1 hypothetical protein [Trichomonas vaginalis G3]